MRLGVTHAVRLAVGQHLDTRLEPGHATRAQRLELPYELDTEALHCLQSCARSTALLAFYVPAQNTTALGLSTARSATAVSSLLTSFSDTPP